MESFDCKVEISTLDRRKKYAMKKVYDNAVFSIRHIKNDNSFHMTVKGGTKTVAFVSSKLEVSDNIKSKGAIAVNIPEFRALVMIQDLPDCDGVLNRIMQTFSSEDNAICEDDDMIKDKENDSNVANLIDSMLTKKLTPEKRISCTKSQKNKNRSPLQSGYTPNKKKDRVNNSRRSPVKMSQSSQFFSLNSSENLKQGSNRDGVDAPTDIVSLTPTQMQVLEKCRQGCNIFLTGEAGTGKSYLLKCILNEMVQMHGKKSVFITATTGVAAVNIGGTTVHQFAGIRPGDTLSELGDSFKQAFKHQSAIRRWRQAEVLIVDEISMMSPSTLELINRVAQDARGTSAMMGGVQVIFTGDFFQLPPVAGVTCSRMTDGKIGIYDNTYTQSDCLTQATLSQNLNNRFCFQSLIWEELFAKENCFVLREVHRQKDEKFLRLLNSIRWGDCDENVFGEFHKCVRKELDSGDGILPTKIFTHRRDVDNLNSIELKKLNGESQSYKAVDDGERTYLHMLQNYCHAKQNITLTTGAQVVLLKTINASEGLVNGSRGVVVDFTKRTKRPIVRFIGGITRPILCESFPISLGGKVVAQRIQIPLDLAWGISVHKSQGMSVDKAVLYIKNAFEYGQVYVALSRVKTMAGLSLSHDLRGSFIKAHPEVKRYYAMLMEEQTA